MGLPGRLYDALMHGGGSGSGPAAAEQAVDHTELSSPMSGSLVKWLVEAGDSVEAGQPVAIVEAMKMETTVAAHRRGLLARGPHEPGAAVGRGDILATIS